MVTSDDVYHRLFTGVNSLGEETIRKVLKNAGLTEKEAEVYIFLAKQGPLKGTEIAKLIKKDKAQIFHILKKLQIKGFAETTLEFPTRYIAVPFENILNSIIKTKHDEVAFIEQAKDHLLDYFRKKRKTASSPYLEKFAVIKGNKKIYAKIRSLIREANHSLSVIVRIPSLRHTSHFRVFDAAFKHPLRSDLQYRFLTELSKQNLEAAKAFLKGIPKTKFNFQAKNPDIGLSPFPGIVIKDDEEILFFISKTRADKLERDYLCLSTNCKSLVQAFTAIFDELWRNSTSINEKIIEIETGKPLVKTQVFTDLEVIRKKYNETIRCAKKDIILMTSPEGLIKYWKTKPLIKNLTTKGISLRIMAPIVNKNLEAAEQLSKICAVRHVPIGYPEATIVDGKHFFQFKASSVDMGKKVSNTFLDNVLYTNDFEYVEKMKKLFNGFWKNASPPSSVTIESILEHSRKPLVQPSSRGDFVKAHFRKISGLRFDERKHSGITEKEVLNKILTAKDDSQNGHGKYLVRSYGSVAGAIIHPPDHFNLPEMVIQAYRVEKQSSLGEENFLVISLWLETPKGFAYVPAAIIGDNPKAQPVWKTWLAGTPAGSNVQLVEKDKLQIRVHGNFFFAGWTIPIRLLPSPYSLPPGCVLFEGYGDIKTQAYSITYPSGCILEIESNGLDAFVTFFHPKSKYSGPGTDGFLARDVAVTVYPPSTA